MCKVINCIFKCISLAQIHTLYPSIECVKMNTYTDISMMSLKWHVNADYMLLIQELKIRLSYLVVCTGVEKKGWMIK